jgi:hypothetical protein
LKLLKPTNKFDDIQKIAASSNFRFWIPDINKFVNLYRSTDGIVALIITKSVESITWLKEYLLQLKSLGITDDEIKICFRMDSVEDKSINFNNWIKEQSLVGDIRKGRLLVFANKPPKWLFKDNLSVTFIATNSLYPIPNIITQKWMDSHSCVLYLGEIKASQIKEKQIEQL